MHIPRNLRRRAGQPATAILGENPSIAVDARGAGMKTALDQLAAHPAGAFALLLMAAALEVFGDSFFQSGMYRSSGLARGLWLVLGIAILAAYGLCVNLPRWDFGRLLGAYVALFFVVAQVVAWLRFDQRPTPPILLGGTLIVAGGLVITFWKG